MTFSDTTISSDKTLVRTGMSRTAQLLCRTFRQRPATIAALPVAIDTPKSYLGTKETAFSPLASLGIDELVCALRRHGNRSELAQLERALRQFHLPPH